MDTMKNRRLQDFKVYSNPEGNVFVALFIITGEMGGLFSKKESQFNYSATLDLTRNLLILNDNIMEDYIIKHVGEDIVPIDEDTARNLRTVFENIMKWRLKFKPHEKPNPQEGINIANMFLYEINKVFKQTKKSDNKNKTNTQFY